MKVYGAYPAGFDSMGIDSINSSQAGLWYALGWAGYSGQMKKDKEKREEKTFTELWTELIMRMWGLSK